MDSGQADGTGMEGQGLEFCTPESNPEVRLRQAAQFADEGDTEKAEALLRELLAENPNYYPARIELGVIYLSQNRLDEAIEENEAATRINPDITVGFVNLAAALIQKGDIDRAINECDEALFIDPNQTDALKNLCWAFLEKGEYNAAIGVSKKLLELEPESGLAYNNMAVAWYHKGEYTKAMENVREALNRGFPVHPELFRELLNRTGSGSVGAGGSA